MTELHAATGGVDHVDTQPYLTFVHGATMNRSAWGNQARYFASRGWNVLAFDNPGHGDSPGPAATSVEELADAIVADLDRRGVTSTALVGHSLGALVSLHIAGTRPELVTHLGLVGAGLALAVNDALLDGTRDDPLLAIDAITDWSLSGQSHIGRSQSPGLWLDGAIRAIARAETARHPGSIHADFAASGGYDGTADAAAVTCPTVVVSGSQDIMTPPKLGKAAVEAISGASYVELDGCGHMIMAERTHETTAALAGLIRAAT